VLGQLGNRVQHALRAFTPRDLKAVKTAAETFRANPDLDVATALTQLGVGEALVSLLDDEGRPGVVDRSLILPPATRLAPLSDAERADLVRRSPAYGHYEHAIDRASAYELLKARAAAAPLAGGTPGAPTGRGGAATRRAPASQEAQIMDALAKSAARAVGSSLGRQLIRGVMGSLLGGGGRRR